MSANVGVSWGTVGGWVSGGVVPRAVVMALMKVLGRPSSKEMVTLQVLPSMVRPSMVIFCFCFFVSSGHPLSSPGSPRPF